MDQTMTHVCFDGQWKLIAVKAELSIYAAIVTMVQPGEPPS
jgi:hypothetical protein